MFILGIETTCDETSVGIVQDGRYVLSNVVSSSADLHKKWGGIVPEVAAREQVKLMVPVLDQAILDANLAILDIDAVAVAHGPGLIGSLLVGVETAKTLALVLDKPLIGVNHLVGHLYANWIEPDSRDQLPFDRTQGKPEKSEPKFPLVALIVSGGHTDLLMMTGVGKFKLLGQTLDDAAGEVFDKVARVLGLGYPGGPEIERVAQQAITDNLQLTHRLPRPMIGSRDFNFSFSGLKTAVANRVKGIELRELERAEIAREFQNAIVDVLIKKTFKAAEKFSAKSIVVGGGVAANSLLRKKILEIGEKNNIGVFFPTKGLSVDNGAMIAAAAFFEKSFVETLKLQADPSLHFD